ncbi:hypothetical protein LI951_12190 [Enterococcus sp. BWT-B8]|uniref:hypothetical protein n=1 Tax=Enterococcus sp. BWT-B8 TaxID=2885157 RepID=UPI001E4D1A74|nr:hypothetical protein [Enterococcus sp. BWT-B8]MCB5952829.1 hypothetical protein [Enterococcus sp. BWT-B8]
MDKKTIDRIKNEKEIPAEVMEKLLLNRKLILTNQISQEKAVKVSRRKKVMFILAAASIVFLLVMIKTPVGTALEKMFGISRDSGVGTVESHGIPNKLDLTSIQNGREIKLTKFVATKKKLAFDYQFKLNDEKLRTLLEKEIAAGSNYQDILLGLFAEGNMEDLFRGVLSYSTFRIEGDMFYGSVIAIFDKEKIPENAKLTLHIYRLHWQDWDEYEAVKAEAIKKAYSSFSVETALVYEGDWSFNVEYEPLTQTAEPQVLQADNVHEIKAKSDALQTTVSFNIPTEGDSGDFQFYDVIIYKNDVKNEAQSSFSYENKNGNTAFDFSFDLSALDNTSVYKIQVNEVDEMGNIVKELGSFELQNK